MWRERDRCDPLDSRRREATGDPRRGVGRAAREVCDRIAEREGAIELVFMHGFPYADNPSVGGHVVAVVNEPAGSAARLAREAAASRWAMRDPFTSDALQPRDAIAKAMSLEGGPIVINEFSDNPGGGAPGDGTHLLSALLDAGVDDAVFCGLVDPKAVESAHQAGVGATIDMRLGGKHDSRSGAPIRCSAYVRQLTDGETV